jgi:hypothetical protein
MIRTVTITVGLGVFATSSGIVPTASADPSQYLRTESGIVRCVVPLRVRLS